MDIHQRLAALGAAIPEICLPQGHVDLAAWAVIACDQFTQDRAFWADLDKAVGDAPSTLRMIFPEVYLGDPGREDRIREIHETMDRYGSGGFLGPPRRCAVYLERATPFHARRRGLVLAVDLERYDWAPQARPLIRATEATLPERLPPRMEIRRGASLEIPHILLLIDDETDTLLPALGDRARRGSPLYQASLMSNGGAVTGWALDTGEDWTQLAQGLEALARRAESRYGAESPARESGSPGAGQPFLYAVGDGNHSLAAAKAVWEEYKQGRFSGDPPARAAKDPEERGEPGGLEDHPARWALVELENLYDPGISFEPIHRVLFGPTAREILELLAELPGFAHYPLRERSQLSRVIGDPAAPGNRVGLIAGDELFVVESSVPGLLVSRLQPLLDGFIHKRGKEAAGTPPGEPGSAGIDYIHGEEELFRLTAPSVSPGPGQGAASSPARQPPVGLLLPPVSKNGLFDTVARSGPLPRKSFSMGEAEEKRFYLECRRLFN